MRSLFSLRPKLRRPSVNFTRRWSSQNQLEIQLKARNGLRWTQPLGLFIDNEFVRSQERKALETVDPL